MPKAAIDDPFRPGEKVQATIDLPRVPAGTEGKIALANGITWRRYWVRFQNGEVLGQVDQGNLVRNRHWDSFHARVAEQERLAAEAAANPTAALETGGGDGGGGDAGNRFGVPQRLLDMSAAARVRLGAPKP
jgi:hypothetical protein